jgi:gluconolactonase
LPWMRKGTYMSRQGRCTFYDRSGKLIDTISVPERPSQLLFGGDERHTLFILARSSLYAVNTINKGR